MRVKDRQTQEAESRSEKKKEGGKKRLKSKLVSSAKGYTGITKLQ